MGDRRAVVVGAGAIALLLSGEVCARPIGDLGRPEPSVLNDVAMPAIGAARARLDGEPVSSFDQSDTETEMANRIWRFVVSPQGDWFYDVAAELRRTRIEVPPGAHFSIDRFYNWLHATPYQSSAVRYATIEEDVGADLATIPDTFTSICRVAALNRQRTETVAGLAGLDAGSRNDVVARRAEDVRQIDWFVGALRYRYDSYNYALDHLLVETPDPAARAVDGDLARLEAEVRIAEAGDFCGRTASPHIGNPHPGPVIPSRFVHGNPAPSNGPAPRPATSGS